jgi:oligoendopeptidase F
MTEHDLNIRLGTTDVIWNLTDLYSSINDPVVKDDIAACEKEATAIKEEFSGTLHSISAGSLIILVQRLEELETKLAKLSTFAFLNFATKINQAESSAFLQKIKEVSSKISTETIFFDLEWNELDTEKATLLLEAEEVTSQRHHLQNIRRYTDHLLSQTEETLLLKKSPVGSSSWTTLFEKVFGHLKFGEKQRTEEEVLADLYNPNRDIRKHAADDLTDGLQSQLHILTHIFNTILADKMISDDIRKYSTWVSTMNLHNELHDETVNTLIDCVTSRYDIVHRYYHLKKELLGLDTLMDYDRYAPLPDLPNDLISWEQCKKTVINGFRNFSPKMAEIGSYFFDRNWIHAPISEGKRGGAFAHPCIPAVHPYVLVNYTGNMRDVSTVAHELGHGVHQYLASGCGYYNSKTPLVLAETASVFAELLIFHNQLESIEDPVKRKAFICQKLESIFATVFRQISMNRFEEKIHNARRESGELSSSALSVFWIETQMEMFGDSVELTENYSNWWSYIPHFLHSPGYVYSYAFGELLVLALYNLYTIEGKSFTPKYIQLLSQGGSLSPYELLKPFGINLDDKLFWLGGLDIIDDMLQRIE